MEAEEVFCKSSCVSGAKRGFCRRLVKQFRVCGCRCITQVSHEPLASMLPSITSVVVYHSRNQFTEYPHGLSFTTLDACGRSHSKLAAKAAHSGDSKVGQFDACTFFKFLSHHVGS
mmetsp:Transcript_8878/g.12988  ORF Transcript_8878/g.12988 Transcript_8878/m.12988 type:complete len:116 (+) Transcript_8878:246-593(+)